MLSLHHVRLPRRLAAICLFAFSGLLPFPSAPLHAQTFDASLLLQPTDLSGIWLVKAGDDPAYAQAGYDDSQWMRVDTQRSLREYFPREHPSVVWYRLHVKVAPNQTGLALEEFYLASAFEIYVNGERLFVNGSVAPYRPYQYTARIVKPIPDAAIATGALTIAMRVYISATEWAGQGPGYAPTNLLIGQRTALNDRVWLAMIGDNLLDSLTAFAGLGLGIVALALYTAQQRQREYLWIFLLYLANALHEALRFYTLFHNLPMWWSYIDNGFDFANLAFATLMFLAFLRMTLKLWLRVWLAISAVGLLYLAWQDAGGSGSWYGVLIGVAPRLILLAGIIPFLLITHWRRGNREAGILLIPAILGSLTIYLQLGLFLIGLVPAFSSSALHLTVVIFTWKIGPFAINSANVDSCLFVLILAVILVLRSARIAQQQARFETELAAAREVQQILMPEQIERVPGFMVETEYVPAQQVGGDFFQILPAPEGSLLLVAGDVAGKGLPAAMLVSVLVGAIRGVAEYTQEPAEMLANLNQRLVGRVAGSMATALAVRIFPGGAVVLANAGHLPPYLDGQEVQVSGALPLGAKSGTRYETIRFQLPRGSRLTFYSDGIVEAQNPAGELFGFERSRAISTAPVAAIIRAAKEFGQHDDMTVIAITREMSTMPQTALAQGIAVPAPAH